MIKLSKSCLSPLEKQAVMRVLDNEFLGMGKEVQLFEQELKQYFGGKAEVVCVNSGTAALHLACQAIGLKAGHEVLVPTLTYVASFQAISATGAMPIACDVMEANGLIDLNDASNRITERTKAIMPVHYAGNMGDLDSIYKFAKKHKLRVIEDAAHGFGSKYKDNLIGSIGDIICFSFDGIKNITSGEGGAIVTKDPEVLKKVKDARLLGILNDTSKRYQGGRSWDCEVSAQGWRYHMSDIMAAIGRVQLQRFEAELKPVRVNLVKRYKQLLRGCDEISFFDNEQSGEVIAYHMPIKVHQFRDQLRDALIKKGISSGVHYKPNHLLTYYQNTTTFTLPSSEKLYKELLTLPLHPGLSQGDVDNICFDIKSFFTEKLCENSR